MIASNVKKEQELNWEMKKKEIEGRVASRDLLVNQVGTFSKHVAHLENLIKCNEAIKQRKNIDD